MTPSNPSPDTGAGTPLTEDSVMQRLSADNPKSRYHREERVDGWSGWSCVPIVDVIEVRAEALEAALRPATDPAGLDALRDIRSFVVKEPAREGAGLHFAISQVRTLDYIDSVIARLSVADGPGPEEWPDLEAAVLFGPVGVTFPNLPHHPTGPDVLDAVAAYMDRQDDNAEGEAAGSGFRANRQVQAHLREWAKRLRAALPVEETGRS